MITKKWIKSLAVCCFMAAVPEMYSASPELEQILEQSGQKISSNQILTSDKVPSDVEKYTIPDTITVIGPQTFSHKALLEEVVIPDSVKYIDKFAFAWCPNLKKIIIPNSVEYIGPYAFTCCLKLQWGTVPNSVKYIGAYAFAVCPKLECIDIPEELEKVEVGTFEGCDKLKWIIIPRSVAQIHETAFCHSGVKYVTIEGNKNRQIDTSVFPNGTEITYTVNDSSDFEDKSLSEDILPMDEELLHHTQIEFNFDYEDEEDEQG